ncbi:hypothetical protein Micbo1qcDRAFT_176453 [Microdochium bolleyi]|uniref:Aminoglycoside phosphotransferase domain-containing protein n=1 Tax=Microdochium bolleyi TaxID=196109 RepID=A0A136J0K5_9PEZI|nr:hypothetical protein Micbo1qcDRAFT_176453 [Microdochium bolleyi]
MPPLDPGPARATLLQSLNPLSPILDLSDHQIDFISGITKGDPCPFYSTRWPTTKTPTPSFTIRPLHHARANPSHMSKSSIVDTIREIVAAEVPGAFIKNIQALPSSSPRRAFAVSLSDGRSLTIYFSPAATTKLLRFEQSLTQSEGLLVQWLMAAALSCPEPAESCRVRQSSDMKAESSTGTSPSTKAHADVPRSATRSAGKDLCRYLPTLISHSSSSKPDLSFNLVEPTKGIPISALLNPLDKADRDGVDCSKGSLARRISQYTSPSGTFGTATSVLARVSPSQSSLSRSLSPEPPHHNGGFATWKTAFHSLLESALRDGEDMAVSISYSRIRKHFSRLSHVLDAVTTPRLVVLHPYSDDNVIVSLGSGAAAPAPKGIKTRAHCVMSRDSAEAGSQHGEKSRPDHVKSEEADGAGSRASLVGFDDWSNCVFGDPLLTSDFTHFATEEYLRGFGMSPTSALGRRILELCGQDDNRHSPSDKSPSPTVSGGHDLVEDPEHAHIRILLYECYHAVVDVVKQFYRPTSQSTDREMAARRRLTRVLLRLEQVTETESRRKTVSPALASSPPSLPPLSPPGETLGDRKSAHKDPEGYKSDHSSKDCSNYAVARQSPVTVKTEEVDGVGCDMQDPKRPRRPSADGAIPRPQKKPKGSSPT